MTIHKERDLALFSVLIKKFLKLFYFKKTEDSSYIIQNME